MAEQKGIRAKAQQFGSYLSGMIMPNIGAFIAWGIITALFIEDGWLPNAQLATMVDPMLHYLLPLLIGFTGGRMVYDIRGGIVGATATMGVIVGADIPMFLGAMVMGPLAGYLMKKIDDLFQAKIRQGFEMLYNNFSAGILAALLAIVAVYAIGPVVEGLNTMLAAGVGVIINAGLLPLANIIIEPAKILFLNNAINHGILSPIGADQASEVGKSILFLLEANPGPGIGILLAFMIFGKGASKSSAPGAAIIQFFGGIHEIYFPYVLMKPILILAVIAGGVSGVFMFQLFGAGLVAPSSPGSIFAVLAMTAQDSYLGVILGVLVAAAVTFVISAIILKSSKTETDSLADATGKMEEMKGKKSSVTGALNQDEEENEDIIKTVTIQKKKPEQIDKIIFACDAGMGSSAMGASLLKNKFKKLDIDISVTNKAINDIPNDADIVITHKDLTDRAKAKVPTAEHISVDNFLNSPKYDELIDRLLTGEVTDDSDQGTEETAPEPEHEKEEVNKIIFACDAGMGSSAMGASLLKNKFKKADIDIFVTNKAINDIPDDADIVITHKDLTNRAKNKLPTAEHISVDNFLSSPKYDELVERLKDN
ncbi:PTS mannitol-specific transporter subunit IIBC [Oceanobacillus indicireducens]|uniref:PTS system mannitol-specific EIICB component n=1 Tax=Oceanobacillus indicireducens TaxID=1004261 RepID=A0A917XYQ1_9BACI|nr:PTS mannitol-specific transporter subunit IIBC [Oceanobacillus indicireducens]GGN58079.1 PTS system mannitol-specific EIICB component [Oceanobacillus indicireducens]